MTKRLVALLALLPVLAFARANIELPSFQFTYGSGQLVEPVAIALGLDSLIYVADQGTQDVWIFSSAGLPLSAFPVGARPAGITVGPDGTVWVSTSDSADVRAFTASGAPLQTLRSPSTGDVPGAFWVPRGIACLDDGTLFVSCSGRDQILRFTPDGAFVREFKTSPYWGSNTGAFTHIPHLAVFADSSLLAAVPFLGEVRRYSPGGTQGPAYTGSFGSPSGVAVDHASQQAWVTTTNAIFQFSAAGDTVGSVAPEPGRWASPRAITADRSGHLHVIVNGNQIARFGMSTVAARATTWGALKARYR